MNNQLVNLRSSQAPIIKFGDRVKQLRMQLRLTQGEVSDECGITNYAVLSRIENNDLVPSLQLASALAKKLKCTVSYLIGESALKDEIQYDILWNDFYKDFTHLPETDMILLSSIAKLMLKNAQG